MPTENELISIIVIFADYKTGTIITKLKQRNWTGDDYIRLDFVLILKDWYIFNSLSWRYGSLTQIKIQGMKIVLHITICSP